MRETWLCSDPNKRVMVCFVIDGFDESVALPHDWDYEHSLSKEDNFVPNEDMEKNMRFLRHENGKDVYLHVPTGGEVFLGRTGKISGNH